MEYYNDKICISYNDLTAGLSPVLSPDNYKNYLRREKFIVARRACRGVEALIYFDSLPTKLKEAVKQKYGCVDTRARRAGLRGMIQTDGKAFQFYQSVVLPTGKTLEMKYINEYTLNASVLNAANAVLQQRKNKRRATAGNVANTWQSVAEEVELIKDEFPHTLPSNPTRLKSKLNQYLKEGYAALISGKFGNNNSRKVTKKLEDLLLSLHCIDTKPYSTDVLQYYLDFISGNKTIVDPQTGEIFDRNDFMDEHGAYIMISESTVWNYLKNPANLAAVDRVRALYKNYNDVHRPHVNRRAPEYSFSKISMDDRDLRKMENGVRVKAYYAYDVTSGCVIGASYSKTKDDALFVECMRDMIRFIDKNNFGMPLEVEVENHIVRNFQDGMMKLGTLFTFIRWCAAANSQEKRAEHLNRQKKYSVEKKNQVNTGRWYARLEANRPNEEKIFDEANNNYRVKTYSFEQIVADDMAAIQEWNNASHPNKKKYPGMSRWEVMCSHLNPDLPRLERAVISRYVGEGVETTIRRSMYVNCLNTKYMLPTSDVMATLKPNDYSVTAYYMPGESVEEVYLYKGDTFICKCDKMVHFNEAQAERTDDDIDAMNKQLGYISHYDASIKSRKPTKVRMIDESAVMEAAQIAAPVVDVPTYDPNEGFDLEELMAEWSSEEFKQKAYDDI